MAALEGRVEQRNAMKTIEKERSERSLFFVAFWGGIIALSNRIKALSFRILCYL
jgi:hypothetical protein